MKGSSKVIQRWTGDAIHLYAAARQADSMRIIVRGNSIEGAIHITGQPQWYRSAVANNLDLKTLAPVEPRIELQPPAGNPAAPPPHSADVRP